MKRVRTWELLLKALSIALLVAGSLSFALPFWTSLMISLKTPAEIAHTPSWALPPDWLHGLNFDNYHTVLTNPNVSFATFFKNTALIATLSTLGVVLSSSFVAYAFARLRFPGRDRIFVLLLSTMMLPPIVTMIPTFLLFKELRWVNTPWPLIVPAWFGGGAFNIFLLRQFYMNLPRELDEAAIIDGASHFTIWSRVIMPLAKPALATVALFSFVGAWRDFMGPLIYLNSVESQTLEVGLATYNSLRLQEWHLIMAGSVLVTLPLIVLFFIGQKAFVKGIATTGIK